MNVCERTRKAIDESPRPYLLPQDAAGHVEQCATCREFADERAALRNLLASTARVTAPSNFEAMLNRRLAEVKGRGRFAWLGPAFYAKVAAAAAAVLIAAVLIPRPGDHPSSLNVANDDSIVRGDRGAGSKAPPGIPRTPPAMHPPEKGPVMTVAATASPRGRIHSTPAPAREYYLGNEGGGTLLIRGETGDVELPVRTVSLGAQPLVYSSDGRQPARPVRTSF